MLLAGKGGGQVATGRHVKYDKETPLANLYLSMAEMVGVKVEHLGDSTGKLNLA